MKRLQAGRLRERFIVQRLREHQDSMGSIVKEWVEIADTRGYVNPIAGDEKFANDIIASETSYYLEMRFMDLRPADRILYDGMILDVKKAINREERDIVLEVLAVDNK